MPLPERSNPQHDALLCHGQLTDTLYLGTTSYKMRNDTTLSLMPDRMFFVNGYKQKKAKEKQLFIYRYGKPETIKVGYISVESSGEGLYFYDDRIVRYNNWAANTLRGSLNVQNKTGRIKDNRLLRINGRRMLDKQISSVRASGGIIRYINGIEGLRNMDLKVGVVSLKSTEKV